MDPLSFVQQSAGRRERRKPAFKLRGVMPMKHSWFHHLECTTQQAEELVARYRQRGVKVERSLNPDFMTWTVSAQLVEDKYPPRPDSRWRNRMWG